MKKNNKTIISIISVIIAVVICFIGYNSYQRKQAEVVLSEKVAALHENLMTKTIETNGLTYLKTPLMNSHNTTLILIKSQKFKMSLKIV